nr:PepSY domain-containing protein [uncultured Devosia sp.]
MKKLALATLALVSLPAIALAQGQAQPSANLDQAAATQQLTDWGLTDIRFDERDDGHYEFDARTANGHRVEIEIGFDGRLLKLDLEDDDNARGAGLVNVLPTEVQSVIADRGIVDIKEFESGRSAWKVEGYTAEGREIEIEIAYAGASQQAAGPDLAAVVQSVQNAGYTVEGDAVARGRHVEIRATNPEGEAVTLHTDFDGVVYRELLRR